MPQIFRLFWLRETGCDHGTILQAHQLEPEIRETVTHLAKDTAGDIVLRLPFLDKIEWRRRGEILAALPWKIEGTEISPALPPTAALRDRAANLALLHPAWINSPQDVHPHYFRVRQSISVHLQKTLRDCAAQSYFDDLSRYEDRSAAHPMLVYQAARVWYGKPPSEFTYDFRDYPASSATLTQALKMTGRTLRGNMSAIGTRLNQASQPALARRYAPIWYEDVLRDVRKRPRRFVDLLAAECSFINAVIDLSSNRTLQGVNQFTRTAAQSLRNVYGMDLRPFGLEALQQATSILQSAQDGMFEKSDVPHCSPVSIDSKRTDLTHHDFARNSQGLRPGVEQAAGPNRLVA